MSTEKDLFFRLFIVIDFHSFTPFFSNLKMKSDVGKKRTTDEMQDTNDQSNDEAPGECFFSGSFNIRF